MVAAVKQVNAHAETMGSQAALFMNINAAKGLLEVMRTNLGPRGTIKMLVGGAGDIKLTKDGNVLLREMQIQVSGSREHPHLHSLGALTSIDLFLSLSLSPCFSLCPARLRTPLLS